MHHIDFFSLGLYSSGTFSQASVYVHWQRTAENINRFNLYWTNTFL